MRVNQFIKIVWQNIHGLVYLSLHGKGFDVFVKEVGREMYSQMGINKPELEPKKVHTRIASNSLMGNILMASKIQEARKNKEVNIVDKVINSALEDDNSGDGDNCFQNNLNEAINNASLVKVA